MRPLLSLLRSSAASCALRPVAVTRTNALLARGIEEFFEDGQALPNYERTREDPSANETVNYGRPWRSEELREKAFEELHQLWYVCLKELNVLASQQQEARRIGTPFLGRARKASVHLTMARIKSELSRRDAQHWRAWESSEAGAWPSRVDSSAWQGNTRRLLEHHARCSEYLKYRQLMRGFIRNVGIFGH